MLSGAGLQACLLVALVVQAVYLMALREIHNPWWRIGAGYVALLLVMNNILWAPATGAITRVALPLTAAFNVLLVRAPRRRFWPWYFLGNLHVIPALWLMPPF